MKKKSEELRQSRVKYHSQPCPVCPSSDAFTIYDDGHGYCFSCKERVDNINSTNIVKEEKYMNFENTTLQFVPRRGMTVATTKFYGIKSYIDKDNNSIAVEFPYTKDYKKVKWQEKGKNKYKTVANTDNDPPLFGQNLFSRGSAQAITITEGEEDAPSVYQMMGSKWPAVSVRSSSTAKKDCKTNYEYLNSFQKIYICFDNDEPGRKAAAEVASLFDISKIYMIKLDKYNDANEYLQANASAEFQRIWYNAEPYRPEGIVSGINTFKRLILEEEYKESVPYPFENLNDMTYGIRTGEIVLFTAMRGMGKTEIMRSIEYNILKTTEDAIGVIHLEEGKVRALKGLAGYELKAPCHLPDSGVSNEQITKSLEKLLRTDNRLHLYTHFDSNDPRVILDRIRFLVSGLGCKYVFLDHITMVVTGSDEDQRKALDEITTKLALMVEELDFALLMVSHINDDGRTRGSRNIENIANIQINLERDHLSENPITRNITDLTITKNRFAGLTGPAGKLFFDNSSFIIRDLKQEDEVSSEVPWVGEKA